MLFSGILVLSGCGPKVALPHPRIFQRSQIVLALHPLALNPFSPSGRPNAWVMNMMYDSLVRINAQGEISGDIAQTWQVQNGARLYVFHLNPHAKWWNGRPISVHDVAWSYTLYANPNAPVASSQSLSSLIASISVPNAGTVAITLKRPDPAFLQNVAAAGDGHPVLPAFMVSRIPLSTLSASPIFNKIPDMMGSGPYRPYAAYPGGIRWIANAHYFLGAPKTRTLITTWTARPPADVSWRSSIPAVDPRPSRYAGSSYTMLLFNFQAPLPAAVREALPGLIDRQTLSRALTAPTFPAVEPVLPGSLYAVPVKTPSGSSILRRAGYKQSGGLWESSSGRVVHLTITASTGAPSRLVAHALQQQLSARGISVTVEFVPDLPRVLARHQFTLALVQRHADPFPKMAGEFGLGAPRNYGSYFNPTFQTRLNAMNSAPNLIQSEHQALAALLSDPPGVYLLWTARAVTISQSVEHFTLNPYDPLETITQWTVARPGK